MDGISPSGLKEWLDAFGPTAVAVAVAVWLIYTMLRRDGANDGNKVDINSVIERLIALEVKVSKLWERVE